MGQKIELILKVFFQLFIVEFFKILEIFWQIWDIFYEIFGYKTITFYGITFQLFHLISFHHKGKFRLTIIFLPHNPFK